MTYLRKEKHSLLDHTQTHTHTRSVSLNSKNVLSYPPQSPGKVEMTNDTLKLKLTKLSEILELHWPRVLSYYLWWSFGPLPQGHINYLPMNWEPKAPAIREFTSDTRLCYTARRHGKILKDTRVLYPCTIHH